MQAHNNTIEEFLGAPKTVFVVPVYQRNYDWQDDNCKQLFRDILGVVESGREHFLGTICFKVYSSHERAIIDGQQRLTSITLLLKAIYDMDDDDDIRDEINGQYIYNKGRGIDTEFMKYKLHLNKRDDEVYHILLGNKPDDVDDKLSASQKKSRVYQNYLLFCDCIRQYVSQGHDVGDILESLRKLTIIELEIQQENPQEIFESLNSTGLDLTNVDLLRNYFLMQFGHSEQTSLYDDYWRRIEDAVGVDRMEQFFVDFLVFRKRSDSITVNGRRSHITEKALYYAFKDYYLSLPFDTPYKKTLHCFKELKECADIYKEFLFPDEPNLDKETPLRRKLYFLLAINETSKARSLLLYVFDLKRRGLINDANVELALDAISSLTFRAKLCKAQGMNRQFAGSVMQRLEEIKDYGRFDDLFWQAITIGKGSYAFPSDKEFKDVLLHKDIYQALRGNGTKHFLYMLELHSPFPKGIPAFDNDSISVDHIMPQNLTQWRTYMTKESTARYDENLHRLGNLALTNYNGEMSNKPFRDKKPFYKASGFYYTRMVEEKYSEWQAAEIDQRTEELANAAVQIWTLPAMYQGGKAASASWHTLDEDTAQFTYTKPSMLLIGNNEYAVTFWSDIPPILCTLLNQDNHDAFLKIANPAKLSAFRIEDDKTAVDKRLSHICDNVYIKTSMSATSLLDMMSRIVMAFDVEAGTDYAENILFSLK